MSKEASPECEAGRKAAEHFVSGRSADLPTITAENFECVQGHFIAAYSYVQRAIKEASAPTDAIATVGKRVNKLGDALDDYKKGAFLVGADVQDVFDDAKNRQSRGARKRKSASATVHIQK